MGTKLVVVRYSHTRRYKQVLAVPENLDLDDPAQRELVLQYQRSRGWGEPSMEGHEFLVHAPDPRHRLPDEVPQVGWPELYCNPTRVSQEVQDLIKLAQTDPALYGRDPARAPLEVVQAVYELPVYALDWDWAVACARYWKSQ